VTRLCVLAGVVCLGVWGWVWHPAAPLTAGLAFLWLAAVRASNKRRAGDRP
jgi:hypothetical protein